MFLQNTYDCLMGGVDIALKKQSFVKIPQCFNLTSLNLI